VFTILFVCLPACLSVRVSVSVWVPPLISCKGLMRWLRCLCVSHLPLLDNGPSVCQCSSPFFFYIVHVVSGRLWDQVAICVSLSVP
jgi:hypothetical protein